MKNPKLTNFAILATLTLAMACTDDYPGGYGSQDGYGRPITLSGEIEQVAATRVNDSGFCDGDEIGVYIVDYQGSTPGTLQASGNRGSNVKHTFDEAAYKWNSAYDVYWKDDHTHIDVYGYYPFGSPEDVNAYSFEVQKDQSTETTSVTMGGYEASDFLWGKVADVAPTEKAIRLPMRHRMSSPRVTLVEGEGFADGEWAGLEKNVLVANTKRSAIINLADGTVTATGEVAETSIIPYKKEDEFRAIVVPQTISAGTTLFTITVDGTAYKFSKAEAFTYTSGKMHNFTIQVDKKAQTGEYTFTLLGESITAWENDDVSHDATMKEYIVINSTAGHLKDSITAAGKDYTQVRNLKVTGEIDALDFAVMNEDMSNLRALNLKKVRIVGKESFNYNEFGHPESKDDAIPEGAFESNKRLSSIILPDKLVKISQSAFMNCTGLTGSLTIPEGVTVIEAQAFYQCSALQGALSLPSTLEKIEYIAFGNCKFTCELQLGESLEYIGDNAFGGCSNLYGNLRLPEKLTYLGSGAFNNCDFTGDLVIPEGITSIESSTFMFCRFNGNLTLHPNITNIEERAFSSCAFRGELVLPERLTTIGEGAFGANQFSKVVLPEGLVSIGNDAFGGNRLMGVLEFPESLLNIGAAAFSGCGSLEGLVFPESVETIGNQAFADCFYIGSIVCESPMPAYVGSGAFDGVPKDNFTLEVPESAVQFYQTTSGWSDFKRIAAHHELVCRPSVANALNTQCNRQLVLNAEGDWIVESQPDWCTLSATEGSQKTELTLTIDAMPSGSGDRTGEIVFKLKDEDYRHTCTVSQYDYQYGENETVTLQRATRGNRGGINLVFLGDGYDAKDISEGKYMEDMLLQVENFFGIEPYTTYRDYFNVYTAIPVSTESGIGTVNTIVYTKFETTYTGGSGLKCDYDAVFQYALDMSTSVTRDNLHQSLIVMVPNSTDYGGITNMWDDGSAIAFCPLSTYDYPLDTRGVLQHEAGGHGFGKLGDEYIYHNAFIDFCDCFCCGHVSEFESAKAKGWYDNLSLTGKTNEVPWSHLIYDEKYSDFVDIFEGGYMHNRGVFRSEQNSCMNNDIPYYSTISRESIVRRIKAYAGEEYSFEDFKANDKVEASVSTRFAREPYTGTSMHSFQMPPQIHRGSPLDNL